MSNSFNTQASSAAANKAGSQYYDFLTMGTGLVSRIRDVGGKRGRSSSVYCTISVPLDPKGAANTRWTNFDVRVCGVENIDLINSLRSEVSNNKRPAIHFTIGDAYGDAYEHNDQVRAHFKGRLIRAELAQNDDRKPLKSYGLAYVNANRMNDSASVQSTFNLSVVHGAVDSINYTYVNAMVADSATSHQARDLICEHAIKDARVLVGFEMSYLSVFGFRFGEQSTKAGQLGTDIVAQLDNVRWIRVNGQVVYKQPAATATQADKDENPQSTEPAADQNMDATASSSVEDADDGVDAGFAGLYEQAYLSGQE